MKLGAQFCTRIFPQSTISFAIIFTEKIKEKLKEKLQTFTTS